MNKVLIFFVGSEMFSRKVGCVQVEEQAAEVEIADGYTMTKFCDKIIDLFLNEKPRVKDWRRYLVFRDDWKKYRDHFYNRCHTLAMSQTDSVMKQKLITLGRKVKRVWIFILDRFINIRVHLFYKFILLNYCLETLEHKLHRI